MRPELNGRYHMLSNRIYIGQLTHKGEHFPAEHPPVVDVQLWEDVQGKLRDNASGTSRRLKAQQPSLLAGFIFDGEDRAKTPSHTTKPGRRYRYYITRPDQLDGSPAWRVSAHDLEQLVCYRLSQFLTDQQAICQLAEDAPADQLQRALQRADIVAATLRSGQMRDKAVLLPTLIKRLALRETEIELIVDRPGMLQTLELPLETADVHDDLMLTLPVAKVRKGHQLRLVIPGPIVLNPNPAKRDDKLVSLIAEAHQAKLLVLANPDKSLATIAANHGRCRTRLGKLAALACLAPDIVTAVVQGRQPATFKVSTLLDIDLPLAWRDQRALLGFC